MTGKSNTMRIDLIPEISDVPLSERPKASFVPGFKPSVASALTGRAPGPAIEAPPAPGPARSPDGYGELFQNIYDAAVITDLHGRIRDVNRRATIAFGYTPAQFSHLTLEQVVSGADTDLVRTLYENLRRQTFTLMQAVCTRSDGTRFPAEVSVSQLRLSTPHLCFLIRDETVRRQTDEMLRTEHNALQNASDAIVVIDLQTKIEYANPATARIWNYASAGDLVGLPLGVLLHNPSDGDAIIESLSGENYDTTGVAIARRSDGESFRIEIHASCNRDSDGNVIGAVLSFSDLTERDRVRIAEHDAESARDALRRLADLHRAMDADVAELGGYLRDLSAAPALAADPALADKVAAALGDLEAMRSISGDVAEIVRGVLTPTARPAPPTSVAED